MEFSLETLVKVLKDVFSQHPDIRYAIGGAIALAEHGYKRYTQDIDVFIASEDLNELASALHKMGLHVSAEEESSQWRARLLGDPEMDRHIDILISYSDPEVAAIQTAVMGKRGLRIMKPEMLALVKYWAYNDSGDPKQAFDLLAMYRMGMFNAKEVRDLILSMNDAYLDGYDELIEWFAQGTRGKRGRPKQSPPGAR